MGYLIVYRSFLFLPLVSLMFALLSLPLLLFIVEVLHGCLAALIWMVNMGSFPVISPSRSSLPTDSLGRRGKHVGKWQKLVAFRPCSRSYREPCTNNIITRELEGRDTLGIPVLQRPLR